MQAKNRADLRSKLSVQSGGVVFTTIQKFFPEANGDTHPSLSGRRNVVVIADEAHRSQYDFVDGFARHMRDALPNASFVGFTGTPIELQDANTRAVFGDYISIYDIQKAVEDGATVPIYYESRLTKLALDEDEKPTIDPEFDEATEGEEIERRSIQQRGMQNARRRNCIERHTRTRRTRIAVGYVNRCVNDIRRRPSQPLIQWRFHPHTVHRGRRLRSTQGPSDA